MKEMMAAIGITLTSFRLCSLFSDPLRISWSCTPCRLPRLGLKCTGSYRKLLTFPKNLTWKVSKPSSTPPSRLTSSAGAGAADNSTLSPNDGGNGTGLNLELDFDLGPSTYATMFIREIAKHVY